MIQSVKLAPSDETDGLPMPKRIWAVISVGFALCMSVLDVNIINIVLPTLSHDFGTSPAVTTWIINGYQLAIVVSLLSFSALGEIIGYRKVYLSGIGLFCDDRPHFSRIQRFGYYKCEHGAVTIYLSEKPARTRNGN